MRGLVLLLLACDDAQPLDSEATVDTAPQDCSQPGDITHFLMRWSKQHCIYLDECTDGDTNYYECVVHLQGSGSWIWDGQDEGFCFDWCAAREAMQLWDQAECGGYWPNIYGGDDWEPVPVYACGETAWP